MNTDRKRKYWYHGTIKKEKIEQEGFSLDYPRFGRRFGNGVYLDQHPQGAAFYGDEVITVEINTDQIKRCSIRDWLKEEDALIRRYGKGFVDQVAPYLQEQGFKALCLSFPSRGSEVCVYDLSVLSLVRGEGEVAW
jgi:hypothetical protein